MEDDMKCCCQTQVLPASPHKHLSTQMQLPSIKKQRNKKPFNGVIWNILQR